MIPIQRLPHHEGLPLPSYATIDSAGMDLIAAIDNQMDIEVAQFERKLIPTGIAIALPRGFEAQIRPRSGLAFKHGITVANSPGTIDADYRGEIFVALINLSSKLFKVTRGMRIAQMVISKHENIKWNIVDSLGETQRGSGGFGSTGE